VTSNKKEVKDKKLSSNVKKFLEKKEAEERKKAEEAKAKKEKLLDLRRGDKKATRTVNSMLHRTKSANKAVVAEAVNRRDTAHTLAGRDQCDEDDYGYESASARAFFEVSQHVILSSFFPSVWDIFHQSF